MDTQVNPSLTPAEEQHALRRDTAVQQALEEVLSSTFFRNTHQCQNLLRYIVKHTLAGEDHLLRERVIGAEVFGRRPDYEPGEDPVVRLRAAEVRKRLAQFYQSGGEIAALHIEIPAGSYKATFREEEEAIAVHRRHPPAVLPEPTESEPHRLVPLPSQEVSAAAPEVFRSVAARDRRRLYVAAAFLLALITIPTVVLSTHWDSAESRRFHTFWAPWTGSGTPVIIAIGSNAVYRLSDSLADQYARSHGLETHGKEFFVPFAPTDTVRGADLVPADSSFVALGDVAAVSHLVANITRQNQRFQERFPNDISFAELRNNPSLLVGGFNNPMTIELTKKLRFVMRARNEIDDTQNPNRRWVLNASPDSHDTEDYAIVTRLAHPGDTSASGDAPMLSVAGMGQYGTLAAADFICNPAAVSEMVRTLPEHWEGRNLQFVLHVTVVDFKVSATQLIATHTW